MTKISNDKVNELDEKIKQLQAQRQQLLNKVKEEERRKRTRNLIQIGGVMNNLGIKTLKQADGLKNEFLKDEKQKAWLDEILKRYDEVSENKNSEGEKQLWVY